MSWSFTAIARDKEKLKAHARKECLAYHKEGTPGHALMCRVADQIGQAIDIFQGNGTSLFKIESHGHIGDDGIGSLKLDINNFFETAFVD